MSHLLGVMPLALYQPLFPGPVLAGEDRSLMDSQEGSGKGPLGWEQQRRKRSEKLCCTGTYQEIFSKFKLLDRLSAPNLPAAFPAAGDVFCPKAIAMGVCGEQWAAPAPSQGALEHLAGFRHRERQPSGVEGAPLLLYSSVKVS